MLGKNKLRSRDNAEQTCKIAVKMPRIIRKIIKEHHYAAVHQGVSTFQDALSFGPS